MSDVKLGILLWSQAATWHEMLDAARRVDRLGYAHLWTWDHLYAIFGDPYQPIFEGWSLLNAWAPRDGADATRAARRREHVPQSRHRRQDGRDARPRQRRPGDPGHRRRLDGARAHGPRHRVRDAASVSVSTGSTSRSSAMRRVLDGESVTSEPGGHYQFNDLRHNPPPVQKRLPIMIGGSGEKKTLRTVARYADMWNAMGPIDVMEHKIEVLQRPLRRGRARYRGDRVHARRQGHDPRHRSRGRPRLEGRDGAQQDAARRRGGRHTFWNGTPQQLADRLRPYTEIGFRTVISEQPAPYDIETLERFIGEVVPLI